MEGMAWRSDAELVHAVRRGEDFAFVQLFERWFDQVLTSAQDILGDPRSAAEVAVDTFHALWHHLDQLIDVDGFGPWALDTSQTFAVDRLNGHGPDRHDEPTSFIPVLPDGSAVSQAVVQALELRGVPMGEGLATSVLAGPSIGGMEGAGTVAGGRILAEETPGASAGKGPFHRYEAPTEAGVLAGLMANTRLMAAAAVVALAAVGGLLFWLIGSNGEPTVAVLGKQQVPEVSVSGAGAVTSTSPGDGTTSGSTLISAIESTTTDSTGATGSTVITTGRTVAVATTSSGRTTSSDRMTTTSTRPTTASSRTTLTSTDSTGPSSTTSASATTTRESTSTVASSTVTASITTTSRPSSTVTALTTTSSTTTITLVTSRSTISLPSVRPVASRSQLAVTTTTRTQHP